MFFFYCHNISVIVFSVLLQMSVNQNKFQSISNYLFYLIPNLIFSFVHSFFLISFVHLLLATFQMNRNLHYPAQGLNSKLMWLQINKEAKRKIIMYVISPLNIFPACGRVCVWMSKGFIIHSPVKQHILRINIIKIRNL